MKRCLRKIARPSWMIILKSYFSYESACERLQVGCLLVDNRIISAGYNGFLPGPTHLLLEITTNRPLFTRNKCIGWYNGCNRCWIYSLYNTLSVYYMLSSLLAAEIKEIKYIDDYKNDELVDVFCKQCDVKVTKL